MEKLELIQRYHEENLISPKGGIVFTGSSLMEQFPVERWAIEAGKAHLNIRNRGISGYTTSQLMQVLEVCVFELEPIKVFINIGTNDLSDPTQTISAIMERYDEIITRIERNLPNVKIYLMAYYPVNYEAASEAMKMNLRVRTNQRINEANAAVKALSQKHGQRYIDVNAPLKDALGRLKAEYTVEGMHINAYGYRAIFDDVIKYAEE